MNNVIDFRLEAVSRSDRVRAWKQFLEEHVMGVGCRNAGEDVQASLRLRRVASGSVNHASFTRQTLYRTRALANQAREDTVLIIFVRNGRHTIRQGDLCATLEGEGIYYLDGSREFEVDFASDDVCQFGLHVPKAALTRRVDITAGLAFDSRSPLQRLVSTFAGGLNDAFETLDDATLDALLNQTLDLFALMVAQGKGDAIEPSTHRAGTLLRIKAYVRAHLKDDELTLEKTARTLGISARYVNALLACEGLSFGRFVLASRLDGARHEIMDPRRVHKQVTEVAFDWGFKNASHFGRAFKEKFGMTPGDAKVREPRR